MTKVLFVSSEVVPFAKTGGLADVAGSLPLALEKIGAEVKIVMPKYKSVRVKGNKTILGKNLEVYFIENEKYFDRVAELLMILSLVDRTLATIR